MPPGGNGPARGRTGADPEDIDGGLEWNGWYASKIRKPMMMETPSQEPHDRLHTRHFPQCPWSVCVRYFGVGMGSAAEPPPRDDHSRRDVVQPVARTSSRADGIGEGEVTQVANPDISQALLLAGADDPIRSL